MGQPVRVNGLRSIGRVREPSPCSTGYLHDRDGTSAWKRPRTNFFYVPLAYFTGMIPFGLERNKRHHEPVRENGSLVRSNSSKSGVVHRPGVHC